MTKMIIDQLKSSNRGKIVFISSVAGLQPYKIQQLMFHQNMQ